MTSHIMFGSLNGTMLEVGLLTCIREIFCRSGDTIFNLKGFVLSPIHSTRMQDFTVQLTTAAVSEVNCK